MRLDVLRPASGCRSYVSRKRFAPVIKTAAVPADSFNRPPLVVARAFMNSSIRRTAATLVLACTSVFASAATPEANQLIADNKPAPSVSDAGIAQTLASHAIAPPNRLRPMTGTSPLIAKIIKPELDVESQKKDRRSKLVWRISVAALLAGTAMDAATSMGKYESNPLLRSADGKFGMKGIAIKGGLAGLIVGPQIAFRDRRELRSKFAIINFLEAGFFGGLAIHNAGIRAPR